MMEKLTKKYPALESIPLEVSQAMHVLAHVSGQRWNAEEHGVLTKWLKDYVAEFESLCNLRTLLSIIVGEKGPITISKETIERYRGEGRLGLKLDMTDDALILERIKPPEDVANGVYLLNKKGRT